jgi:hypothetical protein
LKPYDVQAARLLWFDSVFVLCICTLSPSLTYSSFICSISSFSELVIQYGYGTLFVVALPISSLFSLLSNLKLCSLDAWKLVNLYQRPIPKPAEDIGTWQTVFLLISIASVATNATMIVFTMDVLENFSLSAKFLVFVLFQWGCFIIQVHIYLLWFQPCCLYNMRFTYYVLDDLHGISAWQARRRWVSRKTHSFSC